MPSPFTARVSAPLKVGPLPVPQATTLYTDVIVASGKVSIALLGGFGVASLTLAPGQDEIVPYNGNLECFGPGNVQIHHGRVQHGVITGMDDTGLTSNGYLISGGADREVSNTDTEWVNSDVILQRIMSSVAPLIKPQTAAPQSYIGPGLWQPCPTQWQMNHFNGSTLYEAANEIATATLYYLQARGGRVCSFQRLIAPTQPDFVVARQECPDWEWDTEKQYTRCTVTYTPTDGTGGVAVPSANLTAEAVYDISRSTTISAGSTTYAGALALGEAYLSLNSVPVISAKVGPTLVLNDPLQGPHDAWTAWPGQWVEVQGRGTSYISLVEIDWATGQTTLTLGQPVPDDITFMSRVTQNIRALKRGRNPNSGAPG